MVAKHDRFYGLYLIKKSKIIWLISKDVKYIYIIQCDILRKGKEHLHMHRLILHVHASQVCMKCSKMRLPFLRNLKCPKINLLSPQNIQSQILTCNEKTCKIPEIPSQVIQLCDLFWEANKLVLNMVKHVVPSKISLLVSLS